MLKVDRIYKVFNPGTVNQKIALRDVSINMAEGDFVTLIGGNGAGKSTLLNCVAGVYGVDKGIINIAGNDVTKLAEHRRATMLGRVFQDPMMGTASDMILEENLALALRRGQPRGFKWGITNKERETYKQILSHLNLGLEDRLHTKVGLLSGGQRQAITLIMATIKKPKLLLLDEHTAALDPKTAERVLSMTDQLINENNLTAMMVTHNMRDAIKHGNRLIMMHDGRIILDIKGEEKKKLTVENILERFGSASGEEFSYDRALLS